MMRLPLILLVATTSGLVKGAFQAGCRQGDNCRLPDCSCARYTSPLPVKDTPQMVYFGFDDALNTRMALHFRKLFSSDRRNPNNCPISMSLYIQHKYTDYRLVSEFYKKGMEIAVHSVTHTNIDTEKKLEKEGWQQKDNLARMGNVPKDEIVGWRSPNLKTAGDKQPPTLKKLGYTYDISLTYIVRKLGAKKPWPYTVDYGDPYYCQIRPCVSPTASFPGFWEVPIVALMDYKNAYPCAYVDGCFNAPSNEDEAFKYLWQNFQDYYKTRTPMGFNMHAAWFERPHYKAAMDRFIKKLTKMDDVYIVSVAKMLDWMRQPTKLSELHKLKSWGCKTSTLRDLNSVRGVPAAAVKKTVREEQRKQYNVDSPWWQNKVEDKRADNQWDRTTSSRITTVKKKSAFSTRRYYERKITKTPAVRTASTGTIVTEKSIPEPTIQSRNPGHETCIQGTNCRLPNCQCRSLSPPGGLPVSQVPQLVYFTFDGPVSQLSYHHYSKIFNKVRKNPNNCPISATFFVPRNGNYVPYLKSHVNEGLEIAAYGEEKLARSRNLKNDLSKDLVSALKNFKVVGWRSSSMKPFGELQYSLLRDNHMLYDSTLLTKTAGSALPWPYTLDFPWHDQCPVGGCPKRRYPGLWEVPVKPLLDWKHKYPCVYADGCMNNPWTEEDTYNFLMDNFLKYYKGNRSPMSVSLTQRWFSHPLYRPNVKGLVKFIDKILTMDDVYVVSIKQLIQWLQQPTPLSAMKQFAPWRC